jgi:hypothetical protein
LQLLGKAGRIAGSIERFLAKNRRSLMLAVTVRRRSAETQDHDIRALLADNPDHVREDSVVPPFFFSFLLGFGEAEIDRPGEVLGRAVDLPRGEEFLCAEDAKQ